jgi:hypothetical protein
VTSAWARARGLGMTDRTSIIAVSSSSVLRDGRSWGLSARQPPTRLLTQPSANEGALEGRLADGLAWDVGDERGPTSSAGESKAFSASGSWVDEMNCLPGRDVRECRTPWFGRNKQ